MDRQLETLYTSRAGDGNPDLHQMGPPKPQMGPARPVEQQPSQQLIQALLNIQAPVEPDFADYFRKQVEAQHQADQLARQLDRMDRQDMRARGIAGYFGKKKRAKQRDEIQHNADDYLVEAMLARQGIDAYQQQMGTYQGQLNQQRKQAWENMEESSDRSYEREEWDRRFKAQNEEAARRYYRGPGATDEGLDFGDAAKLRGEFIKATQGFADVTDSYGRIQASVEDPSAAGDLALIFNYMKVLDPGSTVREGEFATAQNSAGVPERMRASYNRVINGERLSDDQRNDFFQRAGKLYNKALQTYQGREREYHGLAERMGFDPRQIFIQRQVLETTQPQLLAPTPGQQPHEGMVIHNPDTGETLIYRNGTWEAYQ